MFRAIVHTLIALTTFALSLSAAPGGGVLIPVFFGDPGAHGSVWRTELTVLNNSDQELPGIQLAFSCAIPEGCPTPFPARATWSTVATDGFKYGLGFFLFPEVDEPDVSYALRVYDESRAQSNYGTDVPVIPIEDFTSRPLQMLDIPNDPTSRVTLRMYAVPPNEPRVRVSIFEDPPLQRNINAPVLPPQLISEAVYELVRSTFSPQTGSFSRPSGIILNDLLANVPPPSEGTLRVEVQSLDEASPIWAFASVTNNTTQLVTTIVPRPPF